MNFSNHCWSAVIGHGTRGFEEEAATLSFLTSNGQMEFAAQSTPLCIDVDLDGNTDVIEQEKRLQIMICFCLDWRILLMAQRSICCMCYREKYPTDISE